MQLFSQSFVVVIGSADIVSAFAKHMLKVFFPISVRGSWS